MRITNRLDLPSAIVAAVSNDEYSRGQSDISVTQLISPPRQVTLIEAYKDTLEEDASDRIFSLFGQAIHKILERAETTAVAEQRLYMNVPGPYGPWVVSGAMDRIEAMRQEDGTVVIQDYKTASVNEMIYGVKPERAQQLNIYKVLAELNGYKVSRLEAVFILRDWSKVKAAEAARTPRFGDNAPTYPQTHVLKYDLPVWEPEEAFRFIAERVAVHQRARFQYAEAASVGGLDSAQQALPECDEEERWARGGSFAAMRDGASRASKVGYSVEEVEAWVAETVAAAPTYTVEERKGRYAVLKDGGTRASKTFDAAETAQQWIDEQAENYTVVERPGEPVRCLYYCSAAAVCDQFKALSAE